MYDIFRPLYFVWVCLYIFSILLAFAINLSLHLNYKCKCTIIGIGDCVVFIRFYSASTIIGIGDTVFIKFYSACAFN